ncbi:MAG TPA: 1-deoxy-D-xylulose-5-phosphate reductoisomerase, partial [Nitrospirota bacterium]|nr:1-deoxy-D-xylulose-5-phosphate reductoisomerase [Nitrospirota bacterium]
MKDLAILGCTGSIGVNTLDVVRRFPGKFRVKALACGSNVKLLEEQAREFLPSAVAVRDRKSAEILKKGLGTRSGIKILHGLDGLVEAATLDGVEMVVSAIVGAAGL